jgi:hypothetical protein
MFTTTIFTTIAVNATYTVLIWSGRRREKVVMKVRIFERRDVDLGPAVQALTPLGPVRLVARRIQHDRDPQGPWRWNRGPFLTSPLGTNFDPRAKVVPWGWSYPLGVKFSVRPSILLNSRECSPLGVNEGVNTTPRGQISPLGTTLTLGWSSPLRARREVKNGPIKKMTNAFTCVLFHTQCCICILMGSRCGCVGENTLK